MSLRAVADKIADLQRRFDAIAGPNSAVVREHVRKLGEALGTDQFDGVFSALSSDPRVGQPEAVAVSAEFTGHTTASTPRGKALARVRDRHDKLMRFKREPSTATRSAS